MAYLGRGLDKISNIEVLDNITFDGSSSYSITKGSVAFTPNSAQSCLISIDGVVQATNFSVNSSTIDFGVAIPSTSVCNFFLHYGTGVMTVPSDGSVTTAKLGDGSVTSAKLDSGIALGKVLQVVNSSNAGNGTSTTSVSYTDTVNSLNITPVSSNSKIVVFADHNFGITGGQSDARIDVRLRETITGVTISDKRYLGKNGTSGSTPINPQVGLTGVFTNSSTAQKNFKVQARKADGNADSSGAIYLNWYTNALHNMVAMEIAQ